MQSLNKESSKQLSFAAFSKGNVVSLDGGKRLRLDDIVDFWPGTGRWHSLCGTVDGDGVTSLLAYLETKREQAGQPVAKPVALETPWRMPCQYCRQPAQLHGGQDVYPHLPNLAQRKFWVCWACNAWVGCHPDGAGDRPLGPLADENLRAARNSAHAAFDPLWKSGEMPRPVAYAWLAKATGIPPSDCHIGMMSAEECVKVKHAVADRGQIPNP